MREKSVISLSFPVVLQANREPWASVNWVFVRTKLARCRHPELLGEIDQKENVSIITKVEHILTERLRTKDPAVPYGCHSTSVCRIQVHLSTISPSQMAPPKLAGFLWLLGGQISWAF